VDSYSGQSYEHRRGWLEKRLLLLSTLFAIDIFAYAVISNHVRIVVHVRVVVHVDKDEALSCDVDKVLRRYHKLHNATLLTTKYIRGDELSPSVSISFNETVAQYHLRLYDISWLMWDLNEYMAYEEDNCTGRFWEGRFKSQALLDESIELTCMAHMDLNPIRTKMEKHQKPQLIPASKNALRQ
jgi:hypothetical protein